MSGCGVLFQFNPLTSTFTKEADSKNFDGCISQGWLAQFNDGNFYGTTFNGDIAHFGNIFKYNPVSGLGASIFNFSNNSYPSTGLTLLNNKFYGTSVIPFFQIFRFNPLDSSCIFIPTGLNGFYSGGLIAVNGYLYGMSFIGGSKNGGTVFKFNPANSNFSVEYDLDSLSNPNGSLLLADDGKLYGMTTGYDTSTKGILFQFDTITKSLVTKHVFGNSPGDGAKPYGSLIQVANGILYGMTTYGGVENKGTIFRYDYINQVYPKLKDLNDSTGTYPKSDLIEVNEITSLPEVEQLNELTLFSNPFSNEIVFQLYRNEPTTFILYDFVGQQVLQQTFASSTTINTTQLAKGIYFYECRTPKGMIKTGKAIKL